MSDLISRQAAIDALERLKKDISGDYTNLDPLVMAGTAYIGDCIGELQDLPSAQPEPQWIPCSERLPSESGEYLITGVGISPCVYQSFYYKSENVWSYRNLTVTAWMPLPEPYKE